MVSSIQVKFKPINVKQKATPVNLLPLKFLTIPKVSIPSVPKSDSVQISKEAEERRRNLDNLLKEGNEKAKAEEKSVKDRMIALEIARRIMHGDRVPKEDEDFLMEYDASLYLKAKAMAMVKKDPEEWDRLSEDDEEGEAGGESSGESGGGSEVDVSCETSAE